MKGTNLGEFEELVLLIIGALKEDAYGVTIKYEIEKHTKRKPSVGALHSALHRLEAKGYVDTRVGEATEKRRGRRKIYYNLTVTGRAALEQARDLRNMLFDLIPNPAKG